MRLFLTIGEAVKLAIDLAIHGVFFLAISVIDKAPYFQMDKIHL
jgi:hypothetical protein